MALVCRVLAYLGEPLELEHVLYETDSSLVRQSYSPRMMQTFLNLAGFGMIAWDPRSTRADEPFVYRVTTLPVFDRNLRALASKLTPTCLVAHVRGVTYSGRDVVAETNLHPFRFPGARVSLAHNGHLREFARMRYDLVPHIRPDLVARIEGSTDSEWLYALVLSRLEDPYGEPTARELADATVEALRTVRQVRRRHGIDTSSPANLFLTTGDVLISTRFSFDYGWYPENDTLLETDLPFVSLWYTLGSEYVVDGGSGAMTPSDAPRSLLVASEPLTLDTSTWLEVPEYSLLAASRSSSGLDLETFDLDV
jgi:glutamine amidotransferase